MPSHEPFPLADRAVLVLRTLYELCERIQRAIQDHGTHNAYFLYNARCAYRLTNDPGTGIVTKTDAAGKQVSVAYAGEMVLETSAPYALRIESKPKLELNDPPAWPAPLAFPPFSSRMATHLHRIAVVIAQGTDAMFNSKQEPAAERS